MSGLFAVIALSAVLTASGDTPDQRLLLLLVPEDAAVATYAEDADEAVSSPLGAWAVGRMAANWSAAAALPAALRDTDVPAVVVVTGDPDGQHEPVGLLVALDLKASSWQPESFVNQRLLPALAKAAGASPVVRRDGLLFEIVVKGWSGPCYCTGRGGQLLISSDREILSGILAGEWPQRKLVLADEYRALSEPLGQRAAVWAYVSLPKFYFLGRSATAKDPFLQRMYYLLAVENFRAMVLQADSVDAGTRLRAVVRVEDAGKGVLSLLGPAATSSAAIDLLPAATSGTLRIAIDDLGGTIGAVNNLVKQIEPEVVEEFDGERVSFECDVGFDPVDDFATNIQDELVIARVGGAGSAPALLLVAGVKDTAKLADQMAALAAAFKVSWRQRPLGTFVLYEPDDSQSGFAYAVGGGRLLIAQRADTIEAVIGGPTTAPAVPGRSGFRRVVAALPPQTRIMVVAPWLDMVERAARWLNPFLPVDWSGLAKLSGQTSPQVGVAVNLDAAQARMVVDVIVAGARLETQRPGRSGPSPGAVPASP